MKIIHLLLLHCHVTVVLSKFKVMWQMFLTIFVKNNLTSKYLFKKSRRLLEKYYVDFLPVSGSVSVVVKMLECLLISKSILTFLLFLKLNDALKKVKFFSPKR
jgi:hypothetical protein